MSFGGGGSLGTAVLTLETDNRNLDRGLRDAERQTKQSTRTMGQSISDIGRSMTGIGTRLTAGLTVPIAGAGTAALKFAGDAQTAGRRIETTFGDEVGRINEFLVDLQDMAPASMSSLQSSASDAMGALTTLGVESGHAADLTEEVLELSANLSAHMDMDFSEALSKVTSGYAGNTQGLRDMAYNINQAMIDTRAYELGLIDQGEAADGAARAQAVHSLVMEQSAGIMDAAANQSDTFNYQLRRMWATVQDAGAALMQDFLPYVTQGVSFITDLVAGFGDLNPTTRRWILIIGGAAAAIGPVMLALGGLLTVVGALVSPLGLVAAGLTALVAIFATDFMGLRTRVMSVLNPIIEGFRTLAEAAYALVTGDFNTFYELLEDAPEFLQPFIEAMEDIWESAGRVMDAFSEDGLLGAISQLGEEIPNIVGVMVELAGHIGSTLLDAIREIDWREVASTIWEYLTTAITTAAGVAWTVATALYTWISDGIRNINWGAVGETLGDLLSSAWSTATGAVSGAYSWISDTISDVDWADIGDTLGNLLSSAWETATSAVTGAYNWVSDTLSDIDWEGIGETLGGHLSSAWNTISSASESAYNWISTTLSETDWEGIGESFGSRLQSAWDYVTDASDRVSTWLSTSLDEVEWEVLAETLSAHLRTMWDFVSSTATQMENWLNTTLEETDWEGIGQSLGSSLQSSWDYVSAVPGRILDWLEVSLERTDFEEIGRIIGRVLTAAWEFVASIPDTIGGWLSGSIDETESDNIAASIGELLLKAIGAAGYAPVAMADWFIESIREADWERIGNVASGLLSAAIDLIAGIREEFEPLDQLFSWIEDHWENLHDHLVEHNERIETALSAPFEWFENTFDWSGWLSTITGWWNDVGNHITDDDQSMRDRLSAPFEWFRDTFGWSSVTDAATDAWDNINSHIDDARTAMETVLANPFEWFRDTFGWSSVTSAATDAWDNIETFIVRAETTMRNALSSPFNWFRDNVGSIMTAAGNNLRVPLNLMIGGMNTMGGGVVGALNWLGDRLDITTLANLSWSTLDEVPAFASGGIMRESGMAVVGEEGPELVVLPSGAEVIPADESAAVLAGVDGPMPDMGQRLPDGVGGWFLDEVIGEGTSFLGDLWGGVTSVFGSIFSGLSDTARDVVEFIRDGASSAFDWMIDNFPINLDLPGVFEEFGTVVADDVRDGLSNFVRDLFSSLEEEIPQEEVAIGGDVGAPVELGGWYTPTVGLFTQGFGHTAFSQSSGWYGPAGHTGIDIANNAGTPIWAANAGTVSGAGWMGGFGNAVRLNHADNLQTLYAHLSRIMVALGQMVAGGQQIGAMGTTGNSTGNHLHFELQQGGVPINPTGIVPFADGGIVTEPTLGLLGEAGPEAVIPLSSTSAADRVSASSIADAVLTAIAEDMDRLPELVEHITEDVLLAFRDMRDDLADQIYLAEIIGDQDQIDDLGDQLDVIKNIMTTWAEETGTSASEAIESILDIEDELEKAEADLERWNDVLENHLAWTQGDIYHEIKEAIAELDEQILTAERMDAPPYVMERLLGDRDEMVEELHEAAEVYRDAIDAGIADSLGMIAEQEFWDEQLAMLPGLIDGSLQANLEEEREEIQRNLAYAIAGDAPYYIIEQFQEALEENEEQLAEVGEMVGTAIEAGFIEGIEPLTDDMVDMLEDLLADTEDIAGSTVDALINAVMDGRVEWDRAMSLIPDIAIPHLERLEEQWTVTLVEAVLDGNEEMIESSEEMLAILANIFDEIGRSAEASADRVSRSAGRAGASMPSFGGGLVGMSGGPPGAGVAGETGSPGGGGGSSIQEMMRLNETLLSARSGPGVGQALSDAELARHEELQRLIDAGTGAGSGLGFDDLMEFHSLDRRFWSTALEGDDVIPRGRRLERDPYFRQLENRLQQEFQRQGGFDAINAVMRPHTWMGSDIGQGRFLTPRSGSNQYYTALSKSIGNMTVGTGHRSLVALLRWLDGDLKSGLGYDPAALQTLSSFLNLDQHISAVAQRAQNTPRSIPHGARPFAFGGVVTDPTLALIGENPRTTPEIVTPEALLRSVFRSELDQQDTQNEIQATVGLGLRTGIQHLVEEMDDQTQFDRRNGRRIVNNNMTLQMDRRTVARSVNRQTFEDMNLEIDLVGGLT